MSAKPKKANPPAPAKRGRPPKAPGTLLVPVFLRLPPAVAAYASEIGGGSVSKGVKLIVEQAHTRSRLDSEYKTSKEI